jgi:hypothetical protein
MCRTFVDTKREKLDWGFWHELLDIATFPSSSYILAYLDFCFFLTRYRNVIQHTWRKLKNNKRQCRVEKMWLVRGRGAFSDATATLGLSSKTRNGIHCAYQTLLPCQLIGLTAMDARSNIRNCADLILSNVSKSANSQHLPSMLKCCGWAQSHFYLRCSSAAAEHNHTNQENTQVNINN